MKVICAGYWKTGTKSVAQALKLLGYKVYDFDDQFFELGDLWNKFFDGSVTDEEIRCRLKDIDVLIDGPVIAFWEEISKAIPEAKVILTTRDEDSWWQSFKGMLTFFPCVSYLFLFMFLTPTGFGFFRNAMRVAHFCQGVEGPFKFPMLNFSGNARLYKYKFRQHNSHVRRAVAADKLLVYEVSSGWEPLCNFLGKEIPDGIDFPYKNKAGPHLIVEGGPQHPGFKRAMVETLCVIAVIISALVYMFIHIFCV